MSVSCHLEMLLLLHSVDDPLGSVETGIPWLPDYRLFLFFWSEILRPPITRHSHL